ncbi:unnamed protein product [Caenorhabditis angaria]|uniref:Uncharacterized protein n=1 Tax=Caenorhabditis angaria TaxID=860376 RepID=A0A9P1IV64_9PELO|nr:unnamed protein product [Caenorhabditis angaria]
MESNVGSSNESIKLEKKEEEKENIEKTGEELIPGTGNMTLLDVRMIMEKIKKVADRIDCTFVKMNGVIEERERAELQCRTIFETIDSEEESNPILPLIRQGIHSAWKICRVKKITRNANRNKKFSAKYWWLANIYSAKEYIMRGTANNFF